MEITKECEGNEMTVKVTGWLDIQTNTELAAFMNDIPVQEKLVLDLSELECISFSGIREIVKIVKRQPQGTFSIVGVNPTVMEVFQMIGFDKKMSITAK